MGVLEQLEEALQQATAGPWEPYLWDDGSFAGMIYAPNAPHKNSADAITTQICTDIVDMDTADAALIVLLRNHAEALLAVAKAAQWAREDSQQLVGMDDPFGSQGPPILVGANAWFALADAVASLETP